MLSAGHPEGLGLWVSANGPGGSQRVWMAIQGVEKYSGNKGNPFFSHGKDVAKTREILSWCQESFPDDRRTLEFQKGLKGNVALNRMTLDLADLEK